MTSTPTKKTLTVKNYEDFRDTLATSGLFEMTDCALEIWCPEVAYVEEIQRMVALVESMVHVTDVKIGSNIENFVSDDYHVVLTADSNTLGRTKPPRGKN